MSLGLRILAKTATKCIGEFQAKIISNLRIKKTSLIIAKILLIHLVLRLKTSRLLFNSGKQLSLLRLKV